MVARRSRRIRKEFVAVGVFVFIVIVVSIITAIFKGRSPYSRDNVVLDFGHDAQSVGVLTEENAVAPNYDYSDENSVATVAPWEDENNLDYNEEIAGWVTGIADGVASSSGEHSQSDTTKPPELSNFYSGSLSESQLAAVLANYLCGVHNESFGSCLTEDLYDDFDTVGDIDALRPIQGVTEVSSLSLSNNRLSFSVSNRTYVFDVVFSGELVANISLVS